MTTQTVTDCQTATIEELRHAFRSRLPILGIHTIATHHGAHNDETSSGYVLQRTIEGKTLFPGIEQAEFGFLSTTQLRQSNMMGDKGFFIALQHGILLLGVGEGPFDEHGDRKDRISCLSMVSQYLDLQQSSYNRKVYGALMSYVNHEDSHGDNLLTHVNATRESLNARNNASMETFIRALKRETNDPKIMLLVETLQGELEKNSKLTKHESDQFIKLQTGSFAQNLKKGFVVSGSTDLKRQKRVFDMAYDYYDNEIDHATLFVESEKEYAITAKNVIDLIVPGQKEQLVLLEMQSDAEEINKVAQRKWRDCGIKKLGVLFLHKRNGQFVLMPSTRHIKPVQMKEVVKLIRETYAYNACFKSPIEFKFLGREGAIDSVPEIYFDDAMGIISNGSKVDPDVAGMIGKYLSVDEIIHAVEVGLNSSYFPKKFAAKCQTGICSGRHCPLYQAGLQRCFDIRSNGQIATAFKTAAVAR